MEVQDLAFGGLHCGASGDSKGSGLIFSFEIFTLLIFMLCEYTNVCFVTTFFLLFFAFVLRSSTCLLINFFFLELNMNIQMGF